MPAPFSSCTAFGAHISFLILYVLFHTFIASRETRTYSKSKEKLNCQVVVPIGEIPSFVDKVIPSCISFKRSTFSLIIMYSLFYNVYLRLYLDRSRKWESWEFSVLLRWMRTMSGTIVRQVYLSKRLVRLAISSWKFSAHTLTICSFLGKNDVFIVEAISLAQFVAVIILFNRDFICIIITIYRYY